MSSDYAGAETFPASIPIPDDGDPRDASSMGVPLEGVMDAARYLKNRGIIAVASFSYDNGGAGVETLSTGDTYNTTSYVSPTNPTFGRVTLADARVGDLVFFTVSLMAEMTGSGLDGLLRLLLTQDYGGGGEVSAGLPGRVFVHSNAGVYAGRSFSGVATVTVAGAARLTIQGKVSSTAGSPSLRIISQLDMRAELVRLP
jgi:hypothetical protein